MFSFDWTDFTEKDLIELNKSKNPMVVYGYIYIEENNKKYIVDVQWSTVSAFGYRGFSINVYKSNELWDHCEWIDDIQTIKSAKNYKRFKTRVESEIEKLLEESNEDR